MHNRILVAYASELGSTVDVARTIGQTLRASGAAVDVERMVDVPDVRQYRAAIIGSPIYNGAWLPEAFHFVQHHATTLHVIPTAYFVVCATARDGTTTSRLGARSFLDPVLQQIPKVRPIDIGLFAGQIDTTKLPWPIRLRMRITTKLRHGDYRDWQAIRAWAVQLVPQLGVGGN